MDALTTEVKNRRIVIEQVLETPEFQPHWKNVALFSMEFQDDLLQANPVITKLTSLAEPILHTFQVKHMQLESVLRIRMRSDPDFLGHPDPVKKKGIRIFSPKQTHVNRFFSIYINVLNTVSGK